MRLESLLLPLKAEICSSKAVYLSIDILKLSAGSEVCAEDSVLKGLSM